MHPLSKDLKLIKDIPCLIIWGKKDNLIPLEYADKFEQELPDAKCVRIEEAGHAPFVEKTTSVYEIIHIFLTQ
jgi:pimeloyl-ACP methyl ester carboxylesterase